MSTLCVSYVNDFSVLNSKRAGNELRFTPGQRHGLLFLTGRKYILVFSAND